MIRLIGIDVDGTLLDSEGRMPAANRDAIHDAAAAGIHVALVTGRSYPEMLEFAGTPVVMANAVEGLKQRGWYLTGHQNEAGLAEAIRRFALP